MDDEDIELKFDECASCRFIGKLRICNSCDAGEQFEADDVESLDELFR